MSYSSPSVVYKSWLSPCDWIGDQGESTLALTHWGDHSLEKRPFERNHHLPKSEMDHPKYSLCQWSSTQWGPHSGTMGKKISPGPGRMRLHSLPWLWGELHRHNPALSCACAVHPAASSSCSQGELHRCSLAAGLHLRSSLWLQGELGRYSLACLASQGKLHRCRHGPMGKAPRPSTGSRTGG